MNIGAFRKGQTKEGQNLIEFIYVFPLLIFLALGIFEFAMFWKDVNVVNLINDEIVANSLLEDFSSTEGTCPYASKALEVLKNKEVALARRNLNYAQTIAEGTEPFAHYKFSADNNVLVLDIDCRNSNSITSQITYKHPMMFIKAKIPNYGGKEAITLFPDEVVIQSNQKRAVKSY